MRSLDESLRARILATLRSQQRWAALEDFLLSLVFLAVGIFLTIVAFWLSILGAAYVLAPFAESRLRPGFFVAVGAVLFAALIIWKHKRILDEDPIPYELGMDSDSWLEDSIRISFEAVFAILFSGPRCVALSWQFAKSARNTLQANIEELAGPIEIALTKRRKIHATDLPEIDFEEFLAKTDWVPGIARLYREPIGFVLTVEFRRQLLGSRPEPPPPPEEPIPPNYDALDEEIRWALLTMGLPPNPTKKQINTAYRDLAKKIHPDLQTDPVAREQNEERMKDLNLAYEILRQKN